MIRILPINSFKINAFRPSIKYSTNPYTAPSLNADTVSFTGKRETKEDIRKIVEDSSNRLEARFNFSQKDIDGIVNNVTPKNRPFLEEILELNNKKLPGKAVSMLLEYINQEDTDVDEFREKLDTFKDLKNILQGRGFVKSVLPEYLDQMNSLGILDLLRGDILLENPKFEEFNTLQFAYNYAVKGFNDRIKKSNIKDEDYHAKNMIKEGTFTSMLALAQVYDKSVLNELFYNRAKYIKTIYMPRFRTLSKDDLENLRKVQTQAVTDKENKGGDYATYEVSLDDKIWTLNFLAANREIINAGEKGLNFEDYVKPVNIYNPDASFKINFQNMKIDLMDKVLRHIGVDHETVDNYMEKYREAYAEDQSLKNHRKDFWDINYAHLLNAPKGSLLRDIVIADSYGQFNKFLYKDGSVANTNLINREDFERNGIDYDKWLNPSIAPIRRKFTDNTGRKTKLFTVKNWDRCAKESLFDGNYTTCCTGIDKDQGPSFPHYLTNTCTTTLEVRTEKNKVIAMSRILMAKINGKLSMVVENIEVNNKMVKHYLYDDETKYKFREMIFDYARAFAKDINKTDKEIPVYFSSKYYKIKDIEKGLEKGRRYEDVELIGEFPDQIYVNAYGGRVDRAKLQFVDDGDGFALNLSNITNKTKPIIEDKDKNIESDSNYNYADTMHF